MEQEDSLRVEPSTCADWRCAHQQLLRLATHRAHLDFDEGAWLLRALRAGTHIELGYATFAEYIERLFGYKPRWTNERLRVAEALGELPLIRRSLRDGTINWSAARELTRVATPTTGRLKRYFGKQLPSLVRSQRRCRDSMEERADVPLRGGVVGCGKS